VECGSGGRGDHALVCTGTQSHQRLPEPHTLACARSLSLSLSLFLSLPLSLPTCLSRLPPSFSLVHTRALPTYSRGRSLAIRERAESGEVSLSLSFPPLLLLLGAFTHLYASDAGPGVRRSVPSLTPCLHAHSVPGISASALVFPVTSRGVRTCVSTCERPVCLHARRQRHAVPHTANPSSLRSPSLATSPPWHGTAPRFTYIRYDTSEPQGRQVAHKTKETRGRNGRRGRARDSDGERSGGDPGRLE